MSHVRKQIRDYFASQLSGETAAGTRVFASRIYPIATDKLPAVLVYASTEESEETAFSKSRVQDRTVGVVVEGYVKAKTTFDDDLDNLARQVEETILDDPSLGGLAKDTTLATTEAEYSGDGETPVGTIRLTFQVNYRTVTGTPGTAI